MKSILLTFPLLPIFVCFAFGQVPIATHVQILKAEDARRYDAVLEGLMKSPNAAVRVRAALAAGRIGDAAAVPGLIRMLNGDRSEKVREMAAFALGETESIEAADAIRIALGETARAQLPGHEGANVRGRLVEAAGKIVAANAQHAKAKELGETTKFILAAERNRQTSVETVRLALTAALRARPAGAEEDIRFFLSHTDPGVVSDALNTLSRLRAKNANRDARDLLATHTHAIVRANAARLLGAAEDKEAVDLLIKATKDADSRVRVSAIRSLAALKDQKAVAPMLLRGSELMASYRKAKRPNFSPAEKSEFLEVATALGRLLQNSGDQRAVRLLSEFRKLDGYESTEVAAAFAQVSPKDFFEAVPDKEDSVAYWKQLRSTAAGMSQLAKLEDKGRSLRHANQTPEQVVREMIDILLRDDMKSIGSKALPDFLQTYAEFKTEDLETVLREQLASEDVWVRAAAAELLATNFASQATRRALVNAFDKALVSDKKDNDAQLALLDAMAKADAAGSVDTIYKALDSPDYLVRKRALGLLDDPKLLAAYPGAANVARDARARNKDKVRPYDTKSGTKLGQMLNKDIDYRRALSRKNGSIRAVFTTQKGTFTIEFLPEDAPLTVDNFVKLARAGYFNGLEVHRVVPNFVMQDGDPRGDGNGGPGWSIRCEMNMVPFERGAVGMALSGKDTGGSQWFVTHFPQPHLDGGYTVFGRVNETGMRVVDRIVRGDKIVTVRILEKR